MKTLKDNGRRDLTFMFKILSWTRWKSGRRVTVLGSVPTKTFRADSSPRTWCRFWWWSWPQLLHSDEDSIQYLTHKFLFLLRQWNHRRPFSHLYKYICIEGSFTVLRCFSWSHFLTPVEVRPNENPTVLRLSLMGVGYDGVGRRRCWRSSVSHLLSNCQGPMLKLRLKEDAAIWESKTVGHQQLYVIVL